MIARALGVRSASAWVVYIDRAAWEHAKATLETLDLDSPGRISTRPYATVNLGEMLVHMVDEAARHAGHMGIVRELVDGAVGSMTAIRASTTTMTGRRTGNASRSGRGGLRRARWTIAFLPDDPPSMGH